MSAFPRTSGLVFPAATLLTVVALAAPVPNETKDTIPDKERGTFLPQRTFQPRAGKVVGVTVGDVAKVMGHDGRGGPPDAVAFSLDGCSYNWVYVPDNDKPIITNLQVRVGAKGDAKKVYPKLGMANAVLLKKWEVPATCALVEVEVNDGDGAPADEGFVATKMKRLDGSAEYPLKVEEVVGELRKRYQDHAKEQAKALDAAFADMQKGALKGEKYTGPRETAELMYVTWMTKEERLDVRFRTTITDGAYRTGGGANIDRDVPLPLPPARGKAFAAFPPPPPPRFEGVRWGTQVGVEYGIAYEVNKQGKVVRVRELPLKTFTKDLPPPPVAPGRPIDPVKP